MVPPAPITNYHHTPSDLPATERAEWWTVQERSGRLPGLMISVLALLTGTTDQMAPIDLSGLRRLPGTLTPTEDGGDVADGTSVM